MQDSLSQGSVSCRLRGGRRCVSALPQQERRAASVRPFRHHAQEDRMSAGKQEAELVGNLARNVSARRVQWKLRHLARIPTFNNVPRASN